MAKKFKAGFVTVVGPPNVGKSTFVNRIVGHYLSIITPKPQTTRFAIKGIKTTKNYQLIFIDTPGYLKPKDELQKLMIENINAAISDADVVVFMVDPFKILSKEIISSVSEKIKDKPMLLAINKIDLIEKNKLLPLIEKYSKEKFKEIFPISVAKNYNVEKLENQIVELLPEAEPYFPEDIISDYTERFFVGELIRESIYSIYGEEIPYTTHVEIDDFVEREKGKWYIRAIIYVERKSQKGIIIGKNGKAIKQLGTSARKKIEQFLDKKVYLELYVKVMEKWRKNKTFIQQMLPF